MALNRKTILGSALGMVVVVTGLTGAASAATGDRNRDRIPDRWEKAHHLSLGVNQANRDQDRDGLKNLAEYRSGTNPRSADSDDDGIRDAQEDRDRDGLPNGAEQRSGTRPDRADSDHDGTDDGAEHSGLCNELHGTVTSFDAATGALVVQAGTETKSVSVTADTRFEDGTAADLTAGAAVEVKYVVGTDGALTATKVELKDGSSSGSDDSGDDGPHHSSGH